MSFLPHLSPLSRRIVGSQCAADSQWVDLEGWQDSLAGPLASVVGFGGCEYVYTRADRYFAGVDDPTTLRRRLLELLAGLQSGIESFAPENLSEVDDKTYMRAIFQKMQSLVERACKLEYERWASENRG